MKQIFIQLSEKHAEEIKVAIVGASGLTTLFTSIDIILKCVVSVIVIIYYGIKIYAHCKNKNQKNEEL